MYVVGTCDWGARATPGFPPKLSIDSWDRAAETNFADHITRVVDWVQRVGGGAKAGAASFGRKTATGLWFNTTNGRWRKHLGAYYEHGSGSVQ